MGLPGWDKRRQLEEELAEAEREATKSDEDLSHWLLSDSYAAGRNRGYADALKHAIKEVYD